MDDDTDNINPTDDSAASGSSSDGSGSNGGNDPQQEQTVPQDQQAPSEAEEQAPVQPTDAPEPAVEDNSESTPPPQKIDQSFDAAQDVRPSLSDGLRNLLAKAGEKIQSNKDKKLDKIMDLARQKGSVDNADVEKLLRASDSTASRYLNQLIKENKLKRSGSPEKPKYEPA